MVKHAGEVGKGLVIEIRQHSKVMKHYGRAIWKIEGETEGGDTCGMMASTTRHGL